MNEQERQSIKAVLESALHNSNVVLDQLKSLVNPKDRSFVDFPMKEAVKQVEEAIQAIEAALKEL